MITYDDIANPPANKRVREYYDPEIAYIINLCTATLEFKNGYFYTNAQESWRKIRSVFSHKWIDCFISAIVDNQDYILGFEDYDEAADKLFQFVFDLMKVFEDEGNSYFKGEEVR